MLVVFAVLAGVLGMHGLTVNHDAMASMRHGAAGSAMSLHANVERGSHAAAAMPAALAHAAPGLRHTHLGDALDGAPMAPMTGTCVAVLVTSLLLALLLARSRRPMTDLISAWVNGPKLTAFPVGRPGATGRPSLFELCVLRT